MLLTSPCPRGKDDGPRQLSLREPLPQPWEHNPTPGQGRAPAGSGAIPAYPAGVCGAGGGAALHPVPIQGLVGLGTNFGS